MADSHYSKNQTYGPYRLEELLGVGSFAEVWKARHTSLGHWFAVKILHPTITKKTTIKRFHTEAKAMCAMSGSEDHRSRFVIRVTDMSDEASETHWMAMELLQGNDLERLSAKYAVHPHEALRITRDIALALQLAHNWTIGNEPNSILHRDLKPANVFYTESGNVKVGDWGLLRIEFLEGEDGTGDAVDHGTVDGMRMGTPGFTAPEQLNNAALSTKASDVYGLGGILAVLIAGFNPGTKGERELHDPDVQNEALVGVHESIRSLIVAMCHIRPKHRPSVDEVIRQLEAAMVQFPLVGDPLTDRFTLNADANAGDFGTTLGEPPSFGKWIVGGVVGVAALLIGAVVLWPTGQPNVPAVDEAPVEQVAVAETPPVAQKPAPAPDPVVVPVVAPVEVKPKEEPKPETPAVPIVKIVPVPVKKEEAKPKADPKPIETAPVAKAAVTEVSVSIVHAQPTVKAGGTVSVEAKVLLPEHATVAKAKLYWKSSAPGATFTNKPVTVGEGGAVKDSFPININLKGSVIYRVTVWVENDSEAHLSADMTTTIE